jgi:hypothetical protein
VSGGRGRWSASLLAPAVALSLALLVLSQPGAARADEAPTDDSATDDGWAPAEPTPEPPPEPEPAPASTMSSGDKLPWQWIQEAWDHREGGRFEQARAALAEALAAGAEPQSIDMELGYVALAEEDYKAARLHFKDATKGADEVLRRKARSAIRYTPSHLWGDFYGDAFGWHRLLPEPHQVTNFVPTVRLRGYVRPWLKVDLDFFVFVQASRDFASRADSPLGYPLIYADNTVMFGGGVQFLFANKTVGLFAQAGPAVHLVPVDGVPPVEFDFRAGAFASVATPKCNPAPILEARGIKATLNPCADVYADLVFVIRPETNLLLFIRGRLSLSYLVTGPVSWAPFVESRFIKDARSHYYNNLADVGLGHRWRLLTPFGLDLTLSVHPGTYLGLEATDPAPAPLGYLDLRLQLSTYVVF